MTHNCKISESILAIVIIVFAVWESTINWLPSKWIIIIAAVLLLIHSNRCKSCDVKPSRTVAKNPARKKASKKRR